MKSIEFMAPFGDVQKRVELSLPGGTANGGWQIYIDNWYQGEIIKRGGEWVGYLNGKSLITGDEIGILGDIIDRYEEEG